MTSQIESIRSTQYTSLYKNEQFEDEISQWRLLKTQTILYKIITVHINHMFRPGPGLLLILIFSLGIVVNHINWPQVKYCIVFSLEALT